jgi:DDE superfamily endonuclease
MARILDLYDRSAAGAVDEGCAGDLRGRVRAAEPAAPTRPGLVPSRRPARLRATYNLYGGVRHMLAGLDLASGQLFYRLRDRKRWQEFLAFLRQLRARFPAGRLHIVCDNFSPHRKAEVADWCADHDVELVFTPTHASWLNSIESALTALRYFTLDWIA